MPHTSTLSTTEPPAPFIHLCQRAGQILLRGKSQHGNYQDLAKPGESDGIFVEWDWNGDRLRFRNCRFGHLPLYYYATANAIVVSVALLPLIEEGAPAELDDTSVAFFLRRGYCAGNDTLFKAIHLLPPNSVGEWRPGSGLRVTGGPVRSIRQNRTPESAKAAFIQLFREAVQRRVPRGAAAVPLSGGRDSRHVLLEMCTAGYSSVSAYTMRHFPPRVDEDARVAALVAEAVGVPHHILEHAPSVVDIERRKNQRMSFATDWGAWFLTVLDEVAGKVNHIYGGYGGDTLSRGTVLDNTRMELWLAGKIEELATFMMTRRPVSELALKRTMDGAAYERFNVDLARTRLVEELHQHVDQPNPDLAYTFTNALRKRTGPQWLPMSSDVSHIYLPFLDHALYDLLTSIPLETMLDIGFHTDAIYAASPQHKNVPFEDKPNVKRAENSFFQRYAREMTEYTVTRDTSEFYDLDQLVERFAACSKNGDARHFLWMEPPRILCLLQLEEALKSAKKQTTVQP